ncbi:aromatic-ring-hydroxylating dioxygenase subunit beta [Alicyclobacillus sp. ALC3]|uniref:aromatic-ring-hydroxylating dioxygenase subunit beta n=1 Tax=Alicyclobacillus sp. ALC3 TaxID=2796143 RepID=UPI002379AF0C|nr:3-phenylpropionate/cinnamic acid dioxygenase subunit beta [Alicyclobacillus sp. ALC3]WDL97739.1 3-phenylpropionate/cinnamic acid dioxygenase subunit beta [Alicyclobacillus sp. ALC3]
MNWEIVLEITDFLYYEAELLDSQQYDKWLNLLSDDMHYAMPVRMTVERKDGEPFASGMSYYAETKATLTSRVHRLYTKTAWVEDPPPRQRHLISNVRVAPLGGDEFEVQSSFLFCRTRASEITIEQLTGMRSDLVRRVEGHWKIAARRVYCDQTVLAVKNLSMFL